MIVKAIRTNKILAGSIDLFKLLDQYITEFPESSVLAITSKIVSLCENRVAPIKGTNRDNLVKRESNYYLPDSISKYGYHFTITNNTLISSAGIDESNGGGNYVLWPSDPQKTANQTREYLRDKFKLKKVGVVIVDSTSTPLRLGTSGVAIGYSGFSPLNDYIGKPDLFGKPFSVSRASIAEGLASAAVLVMGEGTEQTPLALMSDIPFVAFQDRDPTDEELEAINLHKEDDLFAPFFEKMDWLPGDKK